MFGRVSCDEKGFYYVNKYGEIVFLNCEEQIRELFIIEGRYDDIVCWNGKMFTLERKNNEEDANLSKYEITCFEKQKIVGKNIIESTEFIEKRIIDYDESSVFFLVSEPSKQRGIMLQESIYLFDDEKMSLEHVFTIPNNNKWGVIYGYAVCRQSNLIAFACGERVIVVDLLSGESVDSFEGEYFCSVAFHSPKELLIGSWTGMYRAEIE